MCVRGGGTQSIISREAALCSPLLSVTASSPCYIHVIYFMVIATCDMLCILTLYIYSLPPLNLCIAERHMAFLTLFPQENGQNLFNTAQ